MTDQERAILDLEQRWFRHRGGKDTAVLEELGLSATQYAQRLNRLIDDPTALAYAPSTVNRLRRLREQRRRSRIQLG